MLDKIFVTFIIFCEIIITASLGYALYFVISHMLSYNLCGLVLPTLFYFWGGKVRPYFKELQEYIFDKD